MSMKHSDSTSSNTGNVSASNETITDELAGSKETMAATEVHDMECGGKSEKPFVKSEAERKLVRKIALTVMPFVIAIATIQFADKSAVGIAATLGIFQDVHLTGTQFSWLGSIFYLGHLVCQPINNILLQKLPVARLIGICTLIWGSIMLASAYCRTFSQLLALRFLLGLFEGNSLPSIFLIVNTLFRRSEQATYYGYITIGNGFGIIFQALIGYGVFEMGDQRGIIMWRWLHIILGAITMLLGVLCFFFLVDNPQSHLLRLTEHEKALAIERTKDNAVVRNPELKWGQMLEALLEVRFWCICLATFFLGLQGGGFLTFNVIILNSFQLNTPGKTILLKMPIGAFMVLGVVLATFLAQKSRQICYSAILVCSISFAGCLILAVSSNNIANFVGLYLTVFWSGPFSLMTAIIGANVSGYSKKIFYNGALIVCMTVGNFIGPLVMLEKEAPRYTTGMALFCIGNVVAMICLFVMRFNMQRENKHRIANPSNKPSDVNLDLTDKQDRNIIYRV